MDLTQGQIESVQIDYGIVYVNYGLAGERKLGPTRGGGEFSVKAVLRDIEYDGRKGKTKGMQVIDEINATLKVTLLDTSMAELALSMPYADYTGGVIACKSGNVGMVPEAAYLGNVVLFCKTIGGQYKKITLYNAMTENDFALAAKPKGEGEIGLEINAHWDATDDTVDLFKVEDVANIGGDVTKPTLISVPADAAVGVVVGTNLTATFSEAVKSSDVISDNFMLLKASDGSIVAGALTYDPATKVATFEPTVNLAAATAYIWTIARVRDMAGNVMVPVVVNFTTA